MREIKFRGVKVKKGKNEKEKKWIFRIRMKGKDIKISDVISYPASGLEAEEIYLVTIEKEKGV